MVRVLRLVGLIGAALVTGACGLSLFGPDREAWRGEAEARCLASGKVRENAALRLRNELDGSGVCGADRPFVVAGLSEATLAVTPQATLVCPMVSALDDWTVAVLQPSAQAIFGQPVAGLRILGSYGCRTRNNIPGARLSEHAFANALDVGGFELADGRVISVRSGWRGAPDEQAFLRAVHAGACQHFTTVLGPGADPFHYDHLHLDLARHDGRGVHRSCKPRPSEPAVAGPATPIPRLHGVPSFAPVADEPIPPGWREAAPPRVGTAE